MAIESVQTRTFLSLVVGLVVLVVPIALLIIIVVQVVDSSPELALPSTVIGLPVGLLLLGMLLFGLLVSPVPVLTALGSRLGRRRRSALSAYLIGLLVWALVLLVPTLRVFVTLFLAVLGLGAWTLGLVAARGRYEWALQPGSKHRRSSRSEVRSTQALPIDEIWEEEEGEEDEEGEWPEEDWPPEEIGEPFDPETLPLPFEDEEH